MFRLEPRSGPKEGESQPTEFSVTATGPRSALVYGPGRVKRARYARLQGPREPGGPNRPRRSPARVAGVPVGLLSPEGPPRSRAAGWRPTHTAEGVRHTTRHLATRCLGLPRDTAHRMRREGGAKDAGPSRPSQGPRSNRDSSGAGVSSRAASPLRGTGGGGAPAGPARPRRPPPPRRS